jgi:proteasome lid subunit RPN8/RPN11
MQTFRFSRLIVPDEIVTELFLQATAELPDECCGFLAGEIRDEMGVVTHRYPLINRLQSPVRFEVEPKELLRVHRQMRAANLELLAIYHSHPTSEAIPSQIDLAEHFHGPDVLCVILGMLNREMRIWRLSVGERGFEAVEG